ncbi:hypothetical protein H920_06547 [Fukomys damarensis]|uniref:Uncharacterized protein n=1 Tax=Fukomys damarensis TaxID=885580 RepID=A0A091DNB2_FUKDA|nr:hypothetical protein H920_06547 [Fukomys damarensis]
MSLGIHIKVCTGKAQRPSGRSLKVCSGGLKDLLWNRETTSKMKIKIEALQKEDSSQSCFEEKPSKSSFFRQINSMQLSPPGLFLCHWQQSSGGSSTPATLLTQFSVMFPLKLTMSSCTAISKWR